MLSSLGGQGHTEIGSEPGMTCSCWQHLSPWVVQAHHKAERDFFPPTTLYTDFSLSIIVFQRSNLFLAYSPIPSLSISGEFELSQEPPFPSPGVHRTEEGTENQPPGFTKAMSGHQH